MQASADRARRDVCQHGADGADDCGAAGRTVRACGRRRADDGLLADGLGCAHRRRHVTPLQRDCGRVAPARRRPRDGGRACGGRRAGDHDRGRCRRVHNVAMPDGPLRRRGRRRERWHHLKDRHVPDGDCRRRVKEAVLRGGRVDQVRAHVPALAAGPARARERARARRVRRPHRPAAAHAQGGEALSRLHAAVLYHHDLH
mmetsp:Transcript_12893/g.27464  ORF Transcript_12893/g.27464 Transcript_12893/m.27464 type:complete len:201 (+) Transcript_12893:498-1100(+)